MPKEDIVIVQAKGDTQLDPMKSQAQDLVDLQKQVESVVNKMDDLQITTNDNNVHNVEIQEALEQEAKEEEQNDNDSNLVPQNPPKAIDSLKSNDIEQNIENSPITKDKELNNSAENMVDLIKETIVQGNVSRGRKLIQRDREGRRGWQHRNRSNKKRDKSCVDNEKEIKATDKHLQYLEKLKLKKAQQKLDKQKALINANKRKEKLRKQILERCKENTRMRNVESVNNTQSDFYQTQNTINSSKKKSFVIKRLKSSNGEKDVSLGLPPKVRESTTKMGRRGRKQLAPMTSSGIRRLDTLQNDRQNSNSRAVRGSRKRVMSLVPSMVRTPGNMKIELESQTKFNKKGGQRSTSMVKKSKKPKLKGYSFISNVSEWLKKNRLAPKTKVFVISNGYDCIKKALKSRGWVRNPNYFSTCFDFKFTLRGSHIGFDNLNNNQIVNHFDRIAVLTTKIGLTKTLNQLHLFTNVNQDSFFPRCYDCSEEMEFDSFCMYFKQLEAECIIKNYLDLALNDKRETQKYQLYDENDSLQVRVALDVSKRRLMNLGEMIDSKKDWVEVTEKEWNILSRGAKMEEDIKQMIFDKNNKRYEKIAKKEKQLARNKKSRCKKRKKTKKKTITSKIEPIIEEKNQKEEESADEEGEEELSKDEMVLTPLEQECRYIIQKLEKKYPQTRMNGKKNVWIIKPSSLSRGRGIQLFSGFHEIYHHLKTRDYSSVIQKYMENPLCYNKKKMDIRQWVLVTDFNPLTIWFYTECYIRLSTNDYTLDNIKNRFTHLTNNSVNKKSGNFTEEGGFVSQHDFAEFMDKEYGEGAWKRTKFQMKQQIKLSLQAAQASVINRKNSGEILGYDFCIDEDQKVWLIEVNASPDFSFSCSITEDLVKKASEDYVKVMVDWNKATPKMKKTVDTGLFKRIYRSRKHEKCKEAIGLKFECKGKKLNVDKYKKFFKKEDRKFKAKYNQWLDDSESIFDYDSDQEFTVIEEIGAEISKMSIPNVPKDQQNNDQIALVEKIGEESDDSENESF